MGVRKQLPCGDRLFLLTGLLCSVSLLIASPNGLPSVTRDEPLTGVEFRHCTLIYYRAPEHPVPPLDLLDPYDSFQKTAAGELVVLPTSIAYHSEIAGADMRAFRVKTKKGTPILIYQVSPMRRLRFKSDCHGLTFLNGEYWLCNEQVETILEDNGWTTVDEKHVQRGDVAIYRNGHGQIIHSARVVECNAKGQVEVDSKSGYNPEERRVWAERILVH